MSKLITPLFFTNTLKQFYLLALEINIATFALVPERR